MLLRPNEVLHQLPEAWPPKFVFGVMGHRKSARSVIAHEVSPDGDNRAPVCTATNASCMISAIPPSGSVPGHRRRSHRLEPAGPARRKSLSRSSYQHPSSVSGGGVPLGGNSRTNIPRLQVWLCVSRPYPQHGSRYGGLLCMLPRAVPRRHSPGRGRIAHNGVGHTVSLPGHCLSARAILARSDGPETPSPAVDL